MFCGKIYIFSDFMRHYIHVPNYNTIFLPNKVYNLKGGGGGYVMYILHKMLGIILFPLRHASL